jgi:hypothetical protein
MSIDTSLTTSIALQAEAATAQPQVMHRALLLDMS